MLSKREPEGSLYRKASGLQLYDSRALRRKRNARKKIAGTIPASFILCQARYASIGEASGKRSLHFDSARFRISSTCGSSRLLAMASSLTSR
jgi:hypothetical protein